ncbi:DUF6011 domain-containing protein [Mycobacterium sp. 1274756.6]|uniref:DUF6011 domain-containing protein n=1 Tax=Mycobacterium sp. 1274756.6 TaxID=1834076 RepID=UPI003369E69D
MCRERGGPPKEDAAPATGAATSTTTNSLHPTGDSTEEWTLARRCRVCGRFLTSKASVEAGIGAHCAQQGVKA